MGTEQPTCMTPAQRYLLSLLVFGSGILIGKLAEFRRRDQFMLDVPPQEIRRVLSASTVLHIGGQHRGGTTLTWDGLQQHPDISSFMSALPKDAANDGVQAAYAGADEIEQQLRARRTKLYPYISEFRSEGIFLQDVLPKFSLHHPTWPYVPKKAIYELLRTYAPALCERLQLRQGLLGLAEYGFSTETHLTETHVLNSEETASQLFRVWGQIWDLRRPVLMEKSPSNMRISRLLNALWTTAGGSAQFVFVSRHPLMQALAMQEGAFASESTYELVEHWLALEEGLKGDLAYLPPGSHRSLRLDQVVANPLGVMNDLFVWLGLPEVSTLRAEGRATALDEWSTSVMRNPDDKYKEVYHTRLQNAAFQEEHARILRDFSARVRAVSEYVLEDWCEEEEWCQGSGS